MALRENLKTQKRSGLEGLTLSELIEKLVDEIVAYKNNLSEAVEAEKEYITRQYKEKVEPLREELFKREQLYLEYHRKFIRF